jgi:hypothetical protein
MKSNGVCFSEKLKEIFGDLFLLLHPSLRLPETQ